MPIVSLYAALLALLFAALGIRTVLLRRRLAIAVGDGGNPLLLRAMRVHANFAEYVPLTLLLIFFLEQAGAAPLRVHLLCAMLLAGRVLHAIGVSRVREPYALRVVAMTLTFTPLIGAATLLLSFYLARM